MSVEEQMTRRIKLEAIQEHEAEVAEHWPFCRVPTLTVVNYYHQDVPWLLGEVERLKQRNHLEAAVVEAALAERRAGLAMKQTHLFIHPPGTERAWEDALDTYEAAADALLAFDGEEGGDE